MPQLLDIPSELLIEIVKASIPEGFEGLMLACRTTFNVGSKLIGQHNSRKRTWSSVSFERSADRRATLYLLSKIAKEPICARYIQTVDFRCPDWANSQPDHVLEQQWRRLGDEMEVVRALRAFVGDSAKEKLPDIDVTRWMLDIFPVPLDRTMSFPTIAFCTFFLSLLPNVKRIMLPQNWHMCTKLGAGKTMQAMQAGHRRDDEWAALEQLAVTNVRLQRSSLDIGSPLGRLETVAMDGRDRVGLHVLWPFLNMPSVAKVLAENCTATTELIDLLNPPSTLSAPFDRPCSPPDYSFEWFRPELISSVSTLDLRGCCIDSKQLAKLVRHTPHLVNFSYSHGVRRGQVPDGVGMLDWDGGAFVRTLGEHVGPQLRHLAITIDDDEMGLMKTNVASFKAFTRLETLIFDLILLQGPTRIGYRASRSASRPTLARMLPPTLKTLWLGLRCLTADFLTLFLLLDGFQADRAAAVPDLADIRAHSRMLTETVKTAFTYHTFAHPYHTYGPDGRRQIPPDGSRHPGFFLTALGTFRLLDSIGARFTGVRPPASPPASWL